MTPNKLFITGATGFVGRALASKLREDGRFEAVGLARRGPRAPLDGPVRVVLGDLSSGEGYAEELENVDTLVHMAATTGKAKASEYFRVNVEGTRGLLERARAAGVRRVLFISSIAATFPEKKAYPYARSKEEAEHVVAASGLPHLILRPTIVLGEGSPIGKSLRGLAGLPLTPLFGGGRNRIQPVHVDDVARAIVAAIAAGRFEGEAFDVGGPETLTFEDFLRRMVRSVSGREKKAIRLPVKPLVFGLGLFERVFPPVLPVTAGQFYSFMHDGTVKSPPPAELGFSPEIAVEQMFPSSHG